MRTSRLLTRVPSDSIVPTHSSKRPSLTARTTTRFSPVDVATLQNLQPTDVFPEAYREKYGSDPDEKVMQAFHEILLQESQG